MLKINGNKIDFENSLESLIEDMDKTPVPNDKEILNKHLNQKLQKKMLETILSISKSSMHFLVPNFASDYPNYQKKKKKKIFNLSSVLSFEYEFVDFAKEFFGKKVVVEVENPNIIFFVPSNSKYIHEIESSIGEKIENGFLFVVRKVQDEWCLSILGYEVDSEMDCVKEVPIFEAHYFNVKIEHPTSIVDNSAKLYREAVFSVFKNSLYVALNEDEELYLGSYGDFIPSSFMTEKDNNLSMIKQEERIKNQKALITSMEVLYSKSIRF